MANPNSEIWGAPETWIYAKHFNFVGEGDTETRTSKPKTADFGNISGTLAQGDTAGKTPINTPIDVSICPCGQDPTVSCFGSIALFKNKQDASENIIPDNVITATIPCNWFMYDGTGIGGDTYGHKRNWNDTNSIWYPGATTSGNWNMYITPFTYWQLNSVLISVEVATFYDYNWGPSIHWQPLANWKSTYSDRKICDIRLIVRGVSQQTNTTITYQTNTTMADGDMFGFANMDYFGSLIDYAAFCTNSRLGSIFHVLGINDYGNYYDTDRTVILNGYNMFDGQEVKTRSAVSTEHGWLLWYEIPYSDDTYEKIMKMAACFGCVFTNTGRLTISKNMTDEDVYIPIIDDEGVCHGEYTHGSGNLENDLYNADSIRDKNYDPKQIDPNQYSNVTSFNTIDTNAALSKFYVLDKVNVEKLGDDLWTICDSLSEQDYDNFDGKIKDEFLTTNPIDCIISLKRFPFNIPHTFNPNKTAVQLGKSTGTAEGYRTFELFFGVNFKGIDIFPRFGNSFLDYSPYTKYELYIPFCGTVEINPGDILGHKLNLQLRIDLLTGSVVAYIMADQLVIGTANGSCGVDQVLSGTQSATVNSNIINGIINMSTIEQSKMNQFGKMVYPTGWITTALNPFGVVENYNQLDAQQEKQEVDLQHIITPVHKMGTASPLLSWIQEFNARLLIYYPEGNVIDSTQPPRFDLAALASFGHLKGFATVTPGTVNSFRRSDKQCFLRGDILADNIPCTDTERKRIRAALADGVFLPVLSE